MQQYPIWVDINACIYKKSNKSYGIKNDGIQTIYVGSSKSNSHKFATICMSRREIDGKINFRLTVDDTIIKEMTFDSKKGRATDPIKQEEVATI